jgi:hypothetical protein
VRVVAAAAGFTVSKPEPDIAGIDFEVKGTKEVRDDFPRIEVQVKSWSAPSGSEDAWHYRGLTETQFNVLAGKRTVPVFLFLVVVPPDVMQYADASEHVLRLSHAAYWVSLESKTKIAEPIADRHVQVTVPRQQLLTVESLTSLCESSVKEHAPSEIAS